MIYIITNHFYQRVLFLRMNDIPLTSLDITNVKEKIYNLLNSKDRKERRDGIIERYGGWNIKLSITNSILEFRTHTLIANEEMISLIGTYLKEFLDDTLPNYKYRGRFKSIGHYHINQNMTHEEFLSSIPKKIDLSNIKVVEDGPGINDEYDIGIPTKDLYKIGNFTINHKFDQQEYFLMYTTVKVKLCNQNEDDNKDDIIDESLIKFAKEVVDRVINFSLKIRDLSIQDPISIKPFAIIKHINNVIKCDDVTEIIFRYLISRVYMGT